MADPSPRLSDRSSGQKKPRKRVKSLCKEIRKQMEFYFSDANLHKDRFMKKILEESSDSYVMLDRFSNFNRLQALTTDMSLVAKALSTSTQLQVSEDGTRVRRITPLRDVKDVDQRTVYVEGLPLTADHEWLRQTFSACGHVVYVSLPKYVSSGDIKGFGFVEFDSVDATEKACQTLNHDASEGAEKSAKFPTKGCRQLQALQKAVHSKKAELQTSDSDAIRSAKPQKRRGKEKHQVTNPQQRSTQEQTRKGKGTQPQHRSMQEQTHLDEDTNPQQRSTQEQTSKDEETDPQQRSTQELTRKDEDTNSQQQSTQELTRKDEDTDPQQRSTQELTRKDEDTDPQQRSTQELTRKDEDTDSQQRSTQELTRKDEDTDSQQRSTQELTRKDEDTDPKQQSTQEQGARRDDDTDPRRRCAQKRTHATDDSAAPPTAKQKLSHTPPQGATVRESTAEDGMASGDAQKRLDMVEEEASMKVDGSEADGETRKRKLSGGGEPEGGAKKVRINEDVEVSAADGAGKRTRRKKCGGATPEASDTPRLRVMMKERWLELRKEYLKLQKENFHELKQSLLRYEQDQALVESSKMDTELPKADRPIKFTPNVILKMTTTEPIIRKQLKVSLSEAARVAYVDATDGDKEGYVRCVDADAAATLVQRQQPGLQLSLLTGDEERNYWDKLTRDRDKKLSSKAPSKRGRTKVIQKAERAAARPAAQQHVFFED